jgi:Spy/CpxP family protein refolding chaperone
MPPSWNLRPVFLFNGYKEHDMLKLRSIYWAGTALGIALVCVASAEAQRGGGRGGFGGGGFGAFGADSLSLLNNEKVQKELDLTAEQKAGLEKVRSESRADRPDFASFRDLSEDERRTKMEEMRTKMQEQAKATQAKVDALLLPPQVERLKELRIQRLGAGALSDPEVAKALNISDDQKKQLTQVREDGMAKMGELFPRGGGGGGGDETERAARREKMTTFQKEQTDKTLAVLTADQKAQFEKMQGEKFEFPADMGRGGGRGGAGGAAGGGGRRRGGNNNNN